MGAKRKMANSVLPKVNTVIGICRRDHMKGKSTTTLTGHQFNVLARPRYSSEKALVLGFLEEQSGMILNRTGAAKGTKYIFTHRLLPELANLNQVDKFIVAAVAERETKTKEKKRMAGPRPKTTTPTEITATTSQALPYESYKSELARFNEYLKEHTLPGYFGGILDAGIMELCENFPSPFNLTVPMRVSRSRKYREVNRVYSLPKGTVKKHQVAKILSAWDANARPTLSMAEWIKLFKAGKAFNHTAEDGGWRSSQELAVKQQLEAYARWAGVSLGSMLVEAEQVGIENRPAKHEQGEEQPGQVIFTEPERQPVPEPKSQPIPSSAYEAKDKVIEKQRTALLHMRLAAAQMMEACTLIEQEELDDQRLRAELAATKHLLNRVLEIKEEAKPSFMKRIFHRA